MKRTKLFFEKLSKKIGALALGIICLANTYSFADVVGEVSGGGQIQSSKIGQGLFNMVRDITGTLQWIIPVVGVAMSLYYIFKILTGDEQDQQRYKKGIVKVIVSIIVALVSVTIVNLIAKYFGQG